MLFAAGVAGDLLIVQQWLQNTELVLQATRRDDEYALCL